MSKNTTPSPPKLPPKPNPCSICRLEVNQKTAFICYFCKETSHFTCGAAALPAKIVGRKGELTAVATEVFSNCAVFLAFRCTGCQRSPLPATTLTPATPKPKPASKPPTSETAELLTAPILANLQSGIRHLEEKLDAAKEEIIKAGRETTKAGSEELRGAAQGIYEALGAQRKELGDLSGFVGEVTKETGGASFADALKKGLPGDWEKVVSKATKRAIVEQAQEQATEELRARSLVLDNLPKPGQPGAAKTDMETVTGIFKNLGQLGQVEKVFRMGDPNRPQKLKVIMSSAAAAAHLLRKDIRRDLRTAEWEDLFPRLHINPSRTRDERHKIWLLAQRRNKLNREGNLNPDNAWMLDTVRSRLWKKVDGAVNREVNDAPLETWAKEMEEEQAARGPGPSAQLDTTLEDAPRHPAPAPRSHPPRFSH